MALDSKASFTQRAADVGLTDDISNLLTRAFGVNPAAGTLASVHRLFFKSDALALDEFTLELKRAES